MRNGFVLQEKEVNENLRVKIKEHELTIEHLEQQLSSTQKQLEAEAKKPTLSSLDTKEWRAAVVSKMSEEKVKAMMDELHSKVSFCCYMEVSGVVLFSV